MARMTRIMTRPHDLMVSFLAGAGPGHPLDPGQRRSQFPRPLCGTGSCYLRKVWVFLREGEFSNADFLLQILS